MRRIFVMTVGLVIAILMASATLTYLTTGGKPVQILTQQSVKDVQDREPSHMGTDKELFMPACKMDSSLMDRGSKSEKPSPDDRSSADKSQSSNPPIQNEVGSWQCQA
jgi:hypothetical protein